MNHCLFRFEVPSGILNIFLYNKNQAPNIVVVVTGKGPLKVAFERRLASAAMTNVVVVTAWLSTADYAALLGAADLGVCLHTSSSGLDLPMKVVDMYGAGLPVSAVHFSCIDELVHHGTCVRAKCVCTHFFVISGCLLSLPAHPLHNTRALTIPTLLSPSNQH